MMKIRAEINRDKKKEEKKLRIGSLKDKIYELLARIITKKRKPK